MEKAEKSNSLATLGDGAAKDIDDDEQGIDPIALANGSNRPLKSKPNVKGKRVQDVNKQGKRNIPRNQAAKNEKEHKCQLCHFKSSYEYSNKAHVHAHRASHSNTKKCPGASEQKTELISHEEHCRSRHRRRQFQCYLCQKSEFDRTHLKDHMRVHHTGKESFDCKICMERFSSKSSVRRHMKHVH